MEVWRKFKESHRQTKYFVLMYVIYLAALIWTTVQAYARLEYSRSDAKKNIESQSK
jgi:hypothetical protein